MAIYKSVPYRRKGETLPQQARWLEGLVIAVWERRRLLLPYLISLAVLGLLVGVVSVYARHYENQAARLLDSRPWSESREVVQEYPRSPAAQLGRLSLGTEALNQGQWDEAIAALQPVGREEKEILRIVALQNIALAQWMKGEAEAARATLKKAIDDTENPLADYSRLLLAQIDLQSGQKETALKSYADLSQNATIAEVRSFAEGRKKWLEKPAKKSNR